VKDRVGNAPRLLSNEFPDATPKFPAPIFPIPYYNHSNIMEIITESDFCQQRQESFKEGELIYNSDGFDRIERCQDRFSKINCRTVELRPDLNLDICNESFHKSVKVESLYDEKCSLISKFYISGNREVIFPNMKEFDKTSQQTAGNNYLFYLPEIEQIEQHFADEHYHLISIHLGINFLQSFATGLETLPKQLQLLIESYSPQPLHRAIGDITPAMKTVLWQILNAPYQGIIQQIYLESKTLELFVLQLAQWLEAEKGKQKRINLKAHEIDKIHQAKEILISNQAEPPTILNLAQQVEIHHMKLKQGFKEIFGMTLFDYLYNYRMEIAKNLLLENKMNVTQVASTVGYSNSSQFAAAFKRKFGITPKACQMG
jgi:AraC family transcriptional regulator, transcriptional activator of the genes for pyochelin and ferripyochelin receptors